MNETMPRPPFSTQLSGSAREAELRIRNIFSGPKKRPPLPLIILTAAVCLLCGNLVSCRVKEAQNNSPSSGPSQSRDVSLEKIYHTIFKMERIQTDNLTKDILRRFKYSQNLFPEAKDPEEADFLSRFAFICLLSFDAYMKKQLVERMIDETLSDIDKEKKEK